MRAAFPSERRSARQPPSPGASSGPKSPGCGVSRLVANRRGLATTSNSATPDESETSGTRERPSRVPDVEIVGPEPQRHLIAQRAPLRRRFLQRLMRAYHAASSLRTNLPGKNAQPRSTAWRIAPKGPRTSKGLRRPPCIRGTGVLGCCGAPATSRTPRPAPPSSRPWRRSTPPLASGRRRLSGQSDRRGWRRSVSSLWTPGVS